MRKSYGAFKSVDDLLAIRGLGPKRLEKMRRYLTVGKPAAAKPVPLPAKFTPPAEKPPDKSREKFLTLAGRRLCKSEAGRKNLLASFGMTHREGARRGRTTLGTRRASKPIKTSGASAWDARCRGAPGRRCGCRSPRGRRLFSGD